MRKQESFTPSDDQLIVDIDGLRGSRTSRSEMIDILLHAAVKERMRQRIKNAKKGNPQHNAANVY